ncbi:MAG: hypothetical protein RLZZ76_358 [Candidatus Parcubacteria bacterium]|jgi:hypothetical protein
MEGFRPNQYEGEAPSERPDMIAGYRGLHSPEKTTEAYEAIDKVCDVLDEINAEMLFDIFVEYFGRVGNDIGSLDATLSTPGEVGVIYNKKDRSYGFYHPEYGPQLNAYLLKDDKDQVLNTLIHEYLHEVTALYSDWKETQLQSGESGIMQVSPSGFSKITSVYGYEKDTNSVKDRKSLFFFDNQINEGITQILTDDIHAEYVRRSGEGSDSPVRKDRESILFTSDAYLDEQFNMYTYIALISALTEVPEAGVKNAVIRSYFRNGSIVPEEFASLLKDIDLGVDETINEMKRGLESKGFANGIINKLLPVTNLTETEQLRLYERLKELHQGYLKCKEKKSNV